MGYLEPVSCVYFYPSMPATGPVDLDHTTCHYLVKDQGLGQLRVMAWQVPKADKGTPASELSSLCVRM